MQISNILKAIYRYNKYLPEYCSKCQWFIKYHIYKYFNFPHTAGLKKLTNIFCQLNTVSALSQGPCQAAHLMHRADTNKGVALFMTSASDDIAAPLRNSEFRHLGSIFMIFSCRCLWCGHRRPRADYYRIQWCVREETTNSASLTGIETFPALCPSFLEITIEIGSFPSCTNL